MSHELIASLQAKLARLETCLHKHMLHPDCIYAQSFADHVPNDAMLAADGWQLVVTDYDHGRKIWAKLDPRIQRAKT